MTGQTRRKPSVPAPTPQRTAATHASGALEFSSIVSLIENMTLGRNAVGYLTESMHGAGSPQAQRVQIARAMQVEFKKQLARTLAGIAPGSAQEPDEDYLARVFAPVEVRRLRR